MTRLQSLDFHAHVDTDIGTDQLEDLDATIFAVTRSLDEARTAMVRQDRTAVWGVGCHPGLVKAVRGFSDEEFTKLISGSPFVGEVGLDGTSRVPMDLQRATLRSILSTLQQHPRIVSLHSTSATDEIVDELISTPIRGAVLHWWLGSERSTTLAVDLGCYFSVNSSSVERTEILKLLPLERLLPETDHPFGDRYSRLPRQPGNVGAVEQSLAKQFGITPSDIRKRFWANFAQLVRSTESGRLLPRGIRAQLAALES